MVCATSTTVSDAISGSAVIISPLPASFSQNHVQPKLIFKQTCIPKTPPRTPSIMKSKSVTASRKVTINNDESEKTISHSDTGMTALNDDILPKCVIQHTLVTPFNCDGTGLEASVNGSYYFCSFCNQRVEPRSSKVHVTSRKHIKRVKNRLEV